MANYPQFKYYYNNNTEKKGYAGVMTLINTEKVSSDIKCKGVMFFKTNNDEYNIYANGRILLADLGDCYLVNIYTMNSGNKDELRKEFDLELLAYLKNLDKPYILCGDMNVCATEQDYWGNYKKAINTSPGLMDYEIADFAQLVNEQKLTDAYRYMNPNTRKYSWYSTRNKVAYEKGYGWRIDYFLVSDELKDNIVASDIMDGYQAPDHSPITLEINF